jgi:hypothetical protein
VSVRLKASGAKKYALREDTGFVDGDWKDFVPDASNEMVVSYRLSGGDGDKVLYAKYKDEVGNESVSVFDTIVLDTTKPVLGSFAINGGSEYTNSENVVVNISVTGADEMRIACDGVNYSSWGVYSSTYNCVLPSGDGTKTVKAEFRDLAGNVLTGVSDSITLDKTAPQNPAISIKGYRKDPTTGNDIDDVNVTYKTDVVLSLQATGADYVAISNESTLDCSTAVYIPVTFVGNPPTATMNYQLSGGTGTKTVYACFKDKAGNYTARVSDDIYLDQTPPMNVGFIINNGAEYTKSSTVNLTNISGTDNYGGQLYMSISNNTNFSPSTGWINLVSSYNNWSLTSGDGSKYVYLKLRDYAGNESAIAIDGIILDTIAPVAGSVVINGGASYTNQVSVNVQLNVSGDVYEMQVGCDGNADTEPWLIYTNVYTCLLPSGDGNKVVQVRYRDKAGNISNVASGSIMLDTVPPTSPKIITQSKKINADSIKIKLGVLSSDPAPSSGMKYECKDSDGVWRDCTFDSNNERTYTLVQDSENRLGVRAVDGAGNYSAEDFVIITADSTPPEPPKNIRVIEGNTRAYITWDPSPSSDVAGYKIYYGIEAGVVQGIYNGNFLLEGPSPIDVGKRNYINLSSLSNGFKFYITVTAYDDTVEPKPNESVLPNEAYYVLPNEVTPELAGIYDGITQAGSIFVSGIYAYLPDGTDGLKILDVSNPANPVLKGVYPQVADSVYVLGQYAYLASGTEGLKILDVSDPSNPQLKGVYDTPGTASKVFVSNKYAYIADLDKGLQIVDVSNPQSPQFKGNFMLTNCNFYSVFVWGIYAYILDVSRGLIIVDISNPTAPSFKSSYNTGMTFFTDIFVSGRYVYLVDVNNGLYILDTHDPLHPTLLGQYDTSSFTFGIYVLGSYVYLADGDNGLVVLDVSTPSKPVLKGIFPKKWDMATGVYVQGTYAYLVENGNGLQIIELSNPMKPTIEGQFNTLGKADRVFVSGNYAYISEGDEGFEIVDILNPINPSIVSQCTLSSSTCKTQGRVYDLYVSDGYAYVAEGNAGVQIIDVTDPSNPTVKKTFNTGGSARGVYVVSKYLYVANDYEGLEIVDISDPLQPQVLSVLMYGANLQALKIVVVGKYAYLMDYSLGLIIVDVSDPAHPVTKGSINPPGYSNGIFVYGNYVYLLDGDKGLHIIDVSDPSHPQWKNNIYPSLVGVNSGVYVSGKYGYITRVYSLDIVDLTYPEFPITIYSLDLPFAGGGVYVSGNYAYVADGDGGLKIINLEP